METFGYGVRVDDKFLSSHPANQLNSKVTYITVAFFDQFIHWVFKFPNKVAQSLDSKIRGTKVVFKVLNSTTCSTIGDAMSKMLE